MSIVKQKSGEEFSRGHNGEGKFIQLDEKENAGGSMGEKEVEVLSQYDIDVKNTKKVRGAVLCDTKQGLYLVKELDCSEKTLSALYEVQQRLQGQGYKNIDILMKNKEEQLYSRAEDGAKYIVKQWFHGKESDIHKENDILKSVDNLARLHNMLVFEEMPEVRKKEPLKEVFSRHNRELKKIRTFIRGRVCKGEFESLYLSEFDNVYMRAESALEKLDEFECKYRLSSYGNQSAVVHGDYNYHNILMTSCGIATTNFEHIYQGMQIDDFYYFLRKTMEKNQWSIHLGHKMIENYSKEKSISKEELLYLGICLAYPEKFWKAANSYYRSRKSWIPAKSLEKLQLSIKQMEEKRLFLQEVIQLKV